jgi:uncharacterized coiled-coil DUF342 family protein
MSAAESMLSEIREKIDRLGKQKAKLQEKVSHLSDENARLILEIDSGKKHFEELDKEHKVLKMAKSLTGSEGNNGEAKRKINELVREIDKCIALLNK